MVKILSNTIFQSEEAVLSAIMKIPISSPRMVKVFENLVRKIGTKPLLEPVESDAKKIFMRLRYAAKIAKLREESHIANAPLNRFLSFIVEKVEISQKDLAISIGMVPEVFRKLLSGIIRPTELDVEILSSILELFSITVSEFDNLVRLQLVNKMIPELSSINSNALVDNAPREVKRQKVRFEMNDKIISDNFLERIRAELKQRNRQDLIL